MLQVAGNASGIEQDIQKFTSLKCLSKQSNQNVDKKIDSQSVKFKGKYKNAHKFVKTKPADLEEKSISAESEEKKSISAESEEEIVDNSDAREIIPDICDSDLDDASLHEDMAVDDDDLSDESASQEENDDFGEDDVSENDAGNEEFEDDFSGDDVLFGGEEPTDDREEGMEVEEEDIGDMDESDEESKFLTEDKNIGAKEANLMFDDFFEQPSEQSRSSKSKFEVSQEQLQQEIDKLEEMMMDEKPWRLRGEIDAVDRHENAVLEEDLDTQYAALEKPEVSEDVETTLLNLIKAKIKNRDFDNVERKTKQQIQDERGYKKILELNSDKPKPLHEVYEEDFYKKNGALLEVNEDPQKELIRKELNSLFESLDALSSLQFVPRATLPEVKIVHQVPATQVEEPAPVTASTADLLAPEEVLANPSRPLVGKSEMTQTDRKRKHRKLKKHFHDKMIARIEKFGKTKSAKKSSKDEAMKKVLKMAHKPNSNVKIVK